MECPDEEVQLRVSVEVQPERSELSIREGVEECSGRVVEVVMKDVLYRVEY